ncbi:MAG TPA: MFS transporter [Actinomycetota bacterium]|nr:MFS transporter [Actinomycetota bacterium]
MVGTMRLRPSPIWRQKQFMRFWLGESISMIGSSVTGFALPLVAVITLEVSPGEMGLLRAVGAAPAILIGLFAGVWVDRVSRKGLLISTGLIAAALIASIPFAHALGPLSFEHLLAVALCFGMLGPFWWPAWNAFLPSVVQRDLLFEANSKLMFSWSATGVIGPGLGGILVQAVGAPFALLFDAGSFVVSSAFLATVRPRIEERPGDDVVGKMLARIREGLRVTFLDPMQRAVTIPRAILDFLDAFSLSVIVIYVIREVGLSPGLMGLAFALSSVGFVIGSLVAPRFERRFGVSGAILWGLALVGASPYTMVAANDALPDWVNVAFFALPGLIGGFGGVIQYAGLQAIRQSITPERLLGRVYASASFLGDVLWLAGALLGGILAETLGLRPAVVVVAVGYAIPFFYALVSPLRNAGEATRPRTPAPAEG